MSWHFDRALSHAELAHAELAAPPTRTHIAEAQCARDLTITFAPGPGPAMSPDLICPAEGEPTGEGL